MEPAQVTLTGDRWTPFVHTIEYQGDDLTGADFRMQIRLTYDAPGTPLFDKGAVATAAEEGIRLVYGGTATVAAHIAAGRIGDIPDGMQTTDSLSLSIIAIQIAEATMEGMPFPGERGDNAPLYYDMHVTPFGGVKQVWFRGPFIVRAGVTV